MGTFKKDQQRSKMNNKERYEKEKNEFFKCVGPTVDTYDEREYLFKKFYSLGVYCRDLEEKVEKLETQIKEIDERITDSC